MEQPLATSSQQWTNGDIDHCDDSLPCYETNSWILHKFHKSIESNSNNDDDELDRMQDKPKEKNLEWETWTNQPELFELKVNLAGYGHLAILYNFNILTSYFLILSKKWMKVVKLDDEVLILIKQPASTNRLRLIFQSLSDAKRFYDQISLFAETSGGELEHEQQSQKQVLSDPMETVLENVNTIQLCSDPNSGWNTEWPVNCLEGLVRLCLVDPNFPGFVKQIDHLMKTMTTPLDSEH